MADSNSKFWLGLLRDLGKANRGPR